MYVTIASLQSSPNFYKKYLLHLFSYTSCPLLLFTRKRPHNAKTPQVPHVPSLFPNLFSASTMSKAPVREFYSLRACHGRSERRPSSPYRLAGISSPMGGGGRGKTWKSTCDYERWAHLGAFIVLAMFAIHGYENVWQIAVRWMYESRSWVAFFLGNDALSIVGLWALVLLQIVHIKQDILLLWSRRCSNIIGVYVLIAYKEVLEDRVSLPKKNMSWILRIEIVDTYDLSAVSNQLNICSIREALLA